jgi:hypothetical protein
MTKQVQRRRGTATQHTSFTGAEGELSVNTTNKSVHVHDNVTAGGFEAARVDMDNVTSSSILTAAGITATTAELNYVDGVTSNIQTQLDGKAGTASPTFTGTLTTANLTATGTTTLAGASTSADITFGDNDKAVFGAGSDLQIYHAGNASYISDQGTGNLRLDGTDIQIRSASGANMAAFVAGAEVQLYHNNQKKLETTSTGVDVTGTVTADGLTVDGTSSVDSIYTGASSAGVGGAFRAVTNDGAATGSGDRIGYVLFGGAYDASDSIGYNASINAFTTQAYTASARGTKLEFQTTANNSTSRLKRQTIADNGDISFYEDTGTTAKFFWDASAESLGIGTSSPTTALTITESTVGDLITVTGANGTDLRIGNHASANGGIYINSQAASDDLRFRTQGSDRMTITSDGSVGIGTSSPSVPLHVKSTGEAILTLEGATSAGSFVNFGDTADTNVGQIGYDHTSNYMRFKTNDTERMRIDSSGRLLVGKTAQALSTAGFEVEQTGQTSVTQSGASCIRLNRLSSDGDIIQLRKDTSQVGSIGSVASGANLYMSAASGVGLGIGGDNLYPVNASGASTNGSLDIGDSTARFKDLYLSGGVYLGGTGSANKLDDYEEGTWTPSFYGATSVTHDHQVGRYTKVGNLVRCEFTIGTTALSGSQLILIDGLPFTQQIAQNQVATRGEFESIYLNYPSLSTKRYGLSFSSNRLSIRSDASGSGNSALSYSDVANTSLFEIRGSITYRTSS